MKDFTLLNVFTHLVAAHHHHKLIKTEETMCVQHSSQYCNKTTIINLLQLCSSLLSTEHINCLCNQQFSSVKLTVIYCLRHITIKTIIVISISVIQATMIMKLTLTLIKHCSTVCLHSAAEAAC